MGYFHVSMGTQVLKTSRSLTLGWIYSFRYGRKYVQKGNVNNVEAGQMLEGSSFVTNAGYSNFGLLVGFTFNSKKFN